MNRESITVHMNYHDMFLYFHSQELCATICGLLTHPSLNLPLALSSLASRDACVPRTRSKWVFSSYDGSMVFLPYIHSLRGWTS